jgi:hypothetical protein
VTVASKKNDSNIPLEDTLYHTDVPDKLTIPSSVMFKYSLAQYTQLCRFTVPFILKVASSNQTMKSGNQSLPSHMCKNHSQIFSR